MLEYLINKSFGGYSTKTRSIIHQRIFPKIDCEKIKELPYIRKNQTESTLEIFGKYIAQV